MSRIYQSSLAKAGRTITGDDFNKEESNISTAVNKNLGAHNIPCGSVNATKIAERSLDASGSPLIISTGAWADYYECWEQGASATTALIDINLRTEATQGDWTSLADLGIDACEQTITSMRQGTLIGEAFIGWERRYGYHSSTVRGGHNDWTQFGFFVDDKLVRATTRLYPRATFSPIPFWIPIQASSHTFSIKFRYTRGTFSSASNTQYDSQFQVYTAGFTAKNRLR